MQQLGYLGIFAFILIENIFPPIPSEIILVFGGFMTTQTEMKIVGVIGVATVGSLVGAILLYWLGTILNFERIEKFIVKYGRFIGLKLNDLEHIVNQLFLFSKLDIGEFPFYLEPVGIGAELNRIVALVSEEYQKKGLIIDLQENIEKAFVQIDCVQLKSAIINILENSVKYKNKELANMEITCREDEKNILISFSDNGPGVSCEALDALFDIFYRGDPSRSNPSMNG